MVSSSVLTLRPVVQLTREKNFGVGGGENWSDTVSKAGNSADHRENLGARDGQIWSDTVGKAGNTIQLPREKTLESVVDNPRLTLSVILIIQLDREKTLGPAVGNSGLTGW